MAVQIHVDENGTLVDSGKRVVCKKSLYKSTYKGDAFTKKRAYTINSIDNQYIWVTDNEGHQFSFCRQRSFGMHFYEDFFILS